MLLTFKKSKIRINYYKLLPIIAHGAAVIIIVIIADAAYAPVVNFLKCIYNKLSYRYKKVYCSVERFVL